MGLGPAALDATRAIILVMTRQIDALPILMKSVLLLLSIVAAQDPQQPQGIRVTAPEVCQEECRSFDLNNCRSTTTPNDKESWKQVTSQLASCICTAITNNPNCQVCLVNKAPTASVYWSKLDTACSRDEGNVEIAKLWGIDLNGNNPGASLNPDQGSATSTGTSVILLLLAMLL